MSTGTIHIADLAHKQDAIVRAFGKGLQLIEGGIREVFNSTFDEYDEHVDLENEAPDQEPDPSWPNDRVQ